MQLNLGVTSCHLGLRRGPPGYQALGTKIGNILGKLRQVDHLQESLHSCSLYSTSSPWNDLGHHPSSQTSFSTCEGNLGLLRECKAQYVKRAYYCAWHIVSTSSSTLFFGWMRPWRSPGLHLVQESSRYSPAWSPHDVALTSSPGAFPYGCCELAPHPASSEHS